MERKGQGAIEYLLIIGAAILVVAVVVIALTSVTSSGGEAVGEENVNETYDALECQKDCTYVNDDWAAGETCATKYPDICP